MPPRIIPRVVCRPRPQPLAIRSRPLAQAQRQFLPSRTTQRGLATESERTSTKDQPATGPNQDVLGHVSEEAADMGDITGETKPEIDQQGTPVQEILERDPETAKKAPKVIKDEMGKSGASVNAADAEAAARSFANMLALGQMEAISNGGKAADVTASNIGTIASGHKFGVPILPLPNGSHMKHRYDPVVTQITKLMMKDGKLSVAQRHMSMILNYLRTASAPVPNPMRPLLPGSPPPSYLPLNPILYLTVAIDSVAPSLRIRSMKGAAGGGASLQIPVPLNVRQRRRTAFTWILDAVNKRPSKGSGRGTFAKRIADELIAVVEGKSSVWEKRNAVHKLATGARANLGIMERRRRMR